MYATESDACREYAMNTGRAAKEAGEEQQAWVLTPYDTWERNPMYRGPAVRHPEEPDEDEEPFGC